MIEQIKSQPIWIEYDCNYIISSHLMERQAENLLLAKYTRNDSPLWLNKKRDNRKQNKIRLQRIVAKTSRNNLISAQSTCYLTFFLNPLDFKQLNSNVPKICKTMTSFWYNTLFIRFKIARSKYVYQSSNRT